MSRNIVFSLLSLAAVAIATPLHGETIYALLNNDPSVGQRLVSFDSNTRAVTSNVLLQTANTLSPLASIDVRPATGQLYGFDAGARQLVTINAANGVLTPVGSPLTAGTITGGMIDFNPTSDAIRLVGAENQNLRLNPMTGAVLGTDTNIAFASGDGNQGDTPNIRGLGYSNSFAGAATTTLYGIDVDNDVLVTQNPANSGLLQTVGLFGVNLNNGLFGSFNGFDISGTTGNAYLTDGAFASDSNFYQINLTTGAASSLGTISGLPTGRTVADIAVGPVTAVPEPAAAVLLVLACLTLMAGYRR